MSAALASLALSVGACGVSGSSGALDRSVPTAGPTSVTTARSTSTTAPPLTPSTLPPPPAGRDAVATVALTLVDPSRPTVSNGRAVAPSRTLPVTVYLPAATSGRPSPGPHPWLVFLHGFHDVPRTYEPLLRSWVAAGYAVAAPTFPLTSSQSGALLDEADMVNEPADVTFLLTQLLDRSGRPGTGLTGMLDAGRIGVAGHSDGANVAFVSGYSDRFGDPRISVVIDLAGELPVGMGPFDPSPARPQAPLLMFHSSNDEYVPRARSQELFDGLCCRKWWVELEGTSHLPPFAGVEPWAAVVERTSVAFLHRFLGGYAVSVDDIATAARSDVSTLAGAVP